MGYRSILKLMHTETGSTELVTVDDLKTYLQISGTAYDAALADILKTVRRQMEQYANVSLIERDIILTVNIPNTNEFELPFGPVAGVTTVFRKKCPAQWVEVEVGDYYAEYGLFSSEYKGQHRIFYTTDQSDDLGWIQAIKLQAAHVYNNRDNESRNGWDSQALAIIDSLKTPTY